MKTRTFSTRLSAVVLAVASSACAPAKLPAADAPARGEVTAAAPAAAAEPAPATRQADNQARPLHPSATLSSQRIRVDAVPTQSAAPMPRASLNVTAYSSQPRVLTPHYSAAEAPALLMTQPADAAAQAEWTEDLKIMDKLLRDSIARAGREEMLLEYGDASTAMGIAVTTGRAAPMYLEGGGAVFSLSVNWPLARSGKGPAAQEDKPRDPASAWERAKRELKGVRAGGPPPPRPFTFNQEQVDGLIAAIVRVLPEASNMRHLKADEFVFVTVTGADDAGAPVRLTLKARKSDIDDAASGKFKPDEFQQRVARRIG